MEWVVDYLLQQTECKLERNLVCTFLLFFITIRHATDSQIEFFRMLDKKIVEVIIPAW